MVLPTGVERGRRWGAAVDLGADELWTHGCGCPTAYSRDLRVSLRLFPCARVVWSMEQFLLQKGAGFLSIMVLRVLGPSRTPTVAFESRRRRVRLVDFVRGGPCHSLPTARLGIGCTHQ